MFVNDDICTLPPPPTPQELEQKEQQSSQPSSSDPGKIHSPGAGRGCHLATGHGLLPPPANLGKTGKNCIRVKVNQFQII